MILLGSTPKKRYSSRVNLLNPLKGVQYISCVYIHRHILIYMHRVERVQGLGFKWSWAFGFIGIMGEL